MKTRSAVLLALTLAMTLILPSLAAADVPHLVAAGESLSSVAAADGLTVDELAAANGLATDAQLIQGTTIEIPPAGAAPASATATPSSPAAPSTVVPSTVGSQYVVQLGDTLSGIAAADGVSVAALAAENGLDPNGLLIAGRVLALPAPAASTSALASSVEAGNATLPGPTSGPYPTPETVSAGTVGEVASGAGTDPTLAQAVGWQESGFNNDLVSSTGAVGVMQIEPSTWNYINQVLTPGAPLDPYSATDNVRAGSLLLHSLMAQTGGDPSLAAAGYYQGLQSVEQNGMYPSTEQYVQDVLALQSRFGGN